MSEPVSLRALNRATLERQLLLRRAALSAREAVGHLAGLQAQAPLAPYLGLWTRLDGFGHQHLKDLLTERSVVRAHLSELGAIAATHLLPLVQVPPRGLRGSAGQATFVLAAAWLDGPLVAPGQAGGVEQLVLRYLAAYGPARVADIQTWSGLSRLREATERLTAAPRARLRIFAGPDGGQLLDLPDAPRPGPDVPAPPRFLPAYDNLLLSFAERSRIIPHRRPVPLPPGNGASRGTLLLDFAAPAGTGRDVRFARPGRLNKQAPGRSKPVRDLR